MMDNIIHADVIIAGVVIDSLGHGNYLVRTKSGNFFVVSESDIKSIRPEVKVDGEDHRKGN
jgi:hypothetical protein